MKKILGKSGKWLAWIFISVCQLILLSADVCIGVEVEPVNINAKTPNLNIDPSKKCLSKLLLLCLTLWHTLSIMRQPAVMRET